METEANIFFAGCIGALTLNVYFVGPVSASIRSIIPCRGRIAAAYLQAILAGYLAAFVFQVDQPLNAFLIGIGIDSVLVTSRRIALRMGHNLARETDIADSEINV